jgi:molybdopterin molybdotransferase
LYPSILRRAKGLYSLVVIETAMLEVAAALEIVLARTTTRRVKLVKLQPTVAGLVLAESVAADLDSPPFAKSMMDGYAVRSSDPVGVGLRVIEEVAAGRLPTLPVGPGEAIRVMTGAAIPEGADAVVPHEVTDLAGDIVRLREAFSVGTFVIPRGREMTAGQAVAPAGTVLTPVAFGLLAAVGRTTAIVYPRPLLAVLSTGDELIEPPAVPGPGQIRNSNGAMLAALAVRAGADRRYIGIARDDRAELMWLAQQGLDAADVLVLSGGVSAGKFDFVPEVLSDLGVETHFHKIRLKPGKPMLFGTRGNTLVFGLPGNPVSSLVGFELFVRPALRKMSGHAVAGPTFIPVPLTADLSATNDRPTYAPGRLEWTSDGLRVRPGAWFGSADLRAMLGVDALIRLPAGKVAFPAGTSVATLLLSL